MSDMLTEREVILLGYLDMLLGAYEQVCKMVDVPQELSPLKEVERQQLVGAMEACGWHQGKAARQLGITPRQMNYKLAKNGLRAKDVLTAAGPQA